MSHIENEYNFGVVFVGCGQMTNDMDHSEAPSCQSGRQCNPCGPHRRELDCAEKPSRSEMHLLYMYWMPRDMVERFSKHGYAELCRQTWSW